MDWIPRQREKSGGDIPTTNVQLVSARLQHFIGPGAYKPKW